MAHSLKPHTVLIVFGTRPEAIKLAPIIWRLQAEPERYQVRIAASGQHRELLEPMLERLHLIPDFNLHVLRTRQPLTQLTAAMLRGLEKILRRVKPDLVMVQGDTNTTFAGALAAFYHRVPLAHVEAGLRTFDITQPFPEEANRRMVSLMTRWHFAPTPQAQANLLAEGIPRENIFVVGNPVVDALRAILKIPVFLPAWLNRQREIFDQRVVITAHRRENFGRPLSELCQALRFLTERYPRTEWVFPVHRNPEVSQVVKKAFPHPGKNLRLLPPLPYDIFIRLLASARLVLTDSGGIQEEAPVLGVETLVLRQRTERPEALRAGARLVLPQCQTIVAAVSQSLKAASGPREKCSPFGDGRAAERIARALAWIKGDSCQRPKPFVPKRI